MPFFWVFPTLFFTPFFQKNLYGSIFIYGSKGLKPSLEGKRWCKIQAEISKKIVAFKYIMCYITHRTNDTQIGGDQYEHSKIYTKINRGDQ